jgi:hypothetical protein
MLPVCVTQPIMLCGMFGAKRKFDVHTGLDLYCREGAAVNTVSTGKVVDVFQFTGERVGSPWWNDTQAIVVECGEHTYVYGEVFSYAAIGDTVEAGQLIGTARTVLKEDKGITPTTMLHLEVWETEHYIKNFTWARGAVQPVGLLDPLTFIRSEQERLWLIKTECGYKIEAHNGEHLIFYTMAADSKAYLYDKEYTYLKKKTAATVKTLYTAATGKLLWFDKQ